MMQTEITQTLLDKNGNLPQTSGLNWGQRDGREPNQAYIKISSENRNFFPTGRQFTIKTLDNHTFICSIAQQGDKAIHTPNDNSEFGRYFRKKLGVPLGQPIQLHHLQEYGRTYIKFTKIDDNTYIMDF